MPSTRRATSRKKFLEEGMRLAPGALVHGFSSSFFLVVTKQPDFLAIPTSIQPALLAHMLYNSRAHPSSKDLIHLPRRTVPRVAHPLASTVLPFMRALPFAGHCSKLQP